MHKFTSSAQIVSSCYARQCHPETCCCRDGEYAIMDYIYSDIVKHRYYGVITYGSKRDLQDLLNSDTK